MACYMKKIIVACILSLALLDSRAQVDNRDRMNRFSFAFSAGEFSYDSWLGVEVTSPVFFQNSVSFRLKANRNWLETYKATYGHWATYSTVTASIVVMTEITPKVQWYLDVGPFIIFPDGKISDHKYERGISLILGLEMLVAKTRHLNVCYYFGGGIAHCSAYAEKIEDKPAYGNGIVFSNGFRFYF
jgi:hypothetical protein